MLIEERLLEVKEYTTKGYAPVVDYGVWRVAVLNYNEDALPQNIAKLERHNETDEVFVLLKGKCILIIGDGDEKATAIYAQDMEPLKVYDVKKAVWHSTVLSEDASLLIVENMDTTMENSPRYILTEDQRHQLVELARATWSDK